MYPIRNTRHTTKYSMQAKQNGNTAVHTGVCELQFVDCSSVECSHAANKPLLMLASARQSTTSSHSAFEPMLPLGEPARLDASAYIAFAWKLKGQTRRPPTNRKHITNHNAASLYRTGSNYPQSCYFGRPNSSSIEKKPVKENYGKRRRLNLMAKSIQQRTLT